MNEWKLWLSSGLIKNESLINQRTHNLVIYLIIKWRLNLSCAGKPRMVESLLLQSYHLQIPLLEEEFPWLHTHCVLWPSVFHWTSRIWPHHGKFMFCRFSSISWSNTYHHRPIFVLKSGKLESGLKKAWMSLILRTNTMIFWLVWNQHSRMPMLDRSSPLCFNNGGIGHCESGIASVWVYFDYHSHTSNILEKHMVW